MKIHGPFQFQNRNLIQCAISNNPATPMPPPTHMVTTPYFGLAPATLDEDVADEVRACHTERVANGDRATVDIGLFLRDADRVAAVEDLGGKGFIEFPKVDVIYGKTVAFQEI